MSIESHYGLTLQPGLGTGYPDLKSVVDTIINTRIGGLPWLPDGWLEAYALLKKQNPGDVIQLYPSNGTAGNKNIEAPDWQTAEQRTAWTAAALEIHKSIQKYAAGKQDEGRAELQALYRNAAFWDAAYRIDLAIASAPGVVVNAVVEGAGRALSLSLAALSGPVKIVLIVAVLGVGYYFARPFINVARKIA